MGERALKSASSRNGGALNHVGWKSVKSAVYHQSLQLAMSRCETAAAKRFVCPIDPIRQQAATAAAGNAKLLLVDVTSPDQFIDAEHQIFIIVARDNRIE